LSAQRRQWRVYGHDVGKTEIHPAAIVQAASADEARDSARIVLNTPAMLAAGLPYFVISYAEPFDPLILIYPGKIGDDF